MKYAFIVSIEVEDDDQSEPEVIRGVIEDALRNQFKRDAEEYGVEWPKGWSVQEG